MTETRVDHSLQTERLVDLSSSFDPCKKDIFNVVNHIYVKNEKSISLQLFPWNNVRLPSFAHPTRYNITIHPNLTTLEVKGNEESIDDEKIIITFFHVDNDINCKFQDKLPLNSTSTKRPNSSSSIVKI